MKTALTAAAFGLQTGAGIQADIKTALADCIYTVCTTAALNAQRNAGAGNRKRYT